MRAAAPAHCWLPLLVMADVAIGLWTPGSLTSLRRASQARWVVGVSGDVQNSQAARDAERAAADLLRALTIGAPSSEIAELMSVKVKADERVAVLRFRLETPVPHPRKYKPRQRDPAENRTTRGDHP